jgi:hypothetical protein
MGSSRRGTGGRGEDAAPGGGVGLGVGGGDRVDWLRPPATAAGEDRRKQIRRRLSTGFPLPVNLGISYQGLWVFLSHRDRNEEVGSELATSALTTYGGGPPQTLTRWHVMGREYVLPRWANNTRLPYLGSIWWASLLPTTVHVFPIW